MSSALPFPRRLTGRRRGPTLPVALLAATVVTGGATGSALAVGPLQVTPTRVLGLGGAARGAAAGSAALTLNPSGMSLARSYVIDGAYQYLADQNGHLAHVALADSTSASNVGGGLSYTYGTAKPGRLLEGAQELQRHEFGLSLSFPFGDVLAVGGSARYLRTERTLPGGAELKNNDITFDAGVTLRPSSRFTLGFAGYGLRDLKDPQAPSGFGGGIAIFPLPELVITADGVVDRRTYAPGSSNALTVGGGAEYTVAARLALRGGGGRDGHAEGNYGTLGVSLLSESGALDAGGRLDFGGRADGFTLGVSFRLFLPSPPP